MKLFSMGKSRNQTAEEFLKAFLESDLKPMWPQGWMQTRMLVKESKNAHEDVTKGALLQGKQRKASASVEAATLNSDGVRPHTSRTEDVIEISSNFESDEENNSPVVNVTSLNVTPLGPATSQTCPTSQPVLLSSSTDQTSKLSFKAGPLSASVSSQSATVITTSSSQKGGDNSSSHSVKRITPVPLLESPQMSSLKSVAVPNPFNSGFVSSAASPSGTPGSNLQQTQSSNHLQNPHQQKVTLQQKSASVQQMANSQQQKLPQELQKTTNMQQIKAARRSPIVVVNKDTANSSWTKLNSSDPANKSINPVVAVNRIPDNHAQRLSLGSKGSNNILSPGQNQGKITNNSIVKSQQTHKKPQHGPGTSSPSSAGNTSEFTHIVSKSGVASPSVAMSSKQNSLNQNSSQHDSHHKISSLTNPQSKLASSVQRPGQHSDQFVKSGTGGQLIVQATSDFPGRTHQSSSVEIRQSSSAGKPVPSSVSSSTASPPPSSVPTGLLNITTSSLSRSSSPSPQRSPVSPEGNAALSLYEQIKSQIWHQEAMEDQALKNLALALKFGGSTTSTFYGK